MMLSTRLAWEWAVRCFGLDHVKNKGLRSLRLTEEAIELNQALGVPKQKLYELIDVVYSRPVGVWNQELGGVAMTASVMAAGEGVDLDWYFENELSRVLAKSTEHFAKRNQEKLELGLR